MTPVQALAFVEHHGIVLEATRRGTIPSLVDAVVGGTVHGNWWSHPRSRAIFAATRAVRDAPAVLVCRLVDGRISFVHARLWPALVRLADAFPAARLARLREIHLQRGTHRIEQFAFPHWLDAGTIALARDLDEADARAALAAVLCVAGTPA